MYYWDRLRNGGGAGHLCRLSRRAGYAERGPQARLPLASRTSNGIMMCELPEAKAGKYPFTQLFINGSARCGRGTELRQFPTRARAATFIRPTSSRRMSSIRSRVPTMTWRTRGQGPGAFSSTREFHEEARARPQEAVLHIFRGGYWGNLQWRIKTIDYSAARSGLATADSKSAQVGR